MGKLNIVSTPIGNLKDITLRAIETLQEVDGIICEDSRRASTLLNHFKIKKPLIVLNDFNETVVFPKVLQKLMSGQHLALMSDAGTPLIADPGYKLVRECLSRNLEVEAIPGPSSVITALTLSGLPPDKFLFLGYPPEKQGHRLRLFHYLLDRKNNENLKVTYIMFVPPHKLIRTLEDLKEILSDIDVVLAHELTKIHQSVSKKRLGSWLNDLKNPKGEYVLLFRLD